MIEQDRTNRLTQFAERTFALYRTKQLGSELLALTTEGGIQTSGVYAQIEGPCFSARLEPVMVDYDSYLSGSVSLDYPRRHKPVLHLVANRFSDHSVQAEQYLFDSAQPHQSVITLDHLRVIHELRRRIHQAALGNTALAITSA